MLGLSGGGDGKLNKKTLSWSDNCLCIILGYFMLIARHTPRTTIGLDDKQSPNTTRRSPAIYNYHPEIIASRIPSDKPCTLCSNETKATTNFSLARHRKQYTHKLLNSLSTRSRRALRSLTGNLSAFYIFVS